MPIPSVSEKQADRRSQVAATTIRLIAEQGLQGASLRAIAHELGCTTGVLTHYFRNKDELLLFMLEEIMEGMRVHMAAVAQGEQGIERLKMMMLSVLPVNEEFKQVWQVWLAFVGYMPGHQGLLDTHEQHYQQFKAFIRQEMAELMAAGTISPNLDLEFEAAAWIATLDGIGVNMLAAPQKYSETELRILVDRSVRSLQTFSP